MYIVDSHCHLNFPQFKDYLDDVINRALENDVKLMQTICTKLSEFDDIHLIAKKYKNIYCSVGVHPHEVEKEFSEIDQLLHLAKKEKVIGIGETGLDYYYEYSDREKQKQSFIKHIEVARELAMPIIIHTREADEDTISILTDEMKKGEFPGLIHCFTSSQRLADAVIEMGLSISVSGILTFKNATKIQDVIKKIPMNRLLVETDAPFLAPVPFRGKTCEPAYTKNTLEFLADLKNISVEECAEKTTENFFKLFTKADQE
ncbi:MAG: TatD family hydrolase [Rickettsiales bacterium]